MALWKARSLSIEQKVRLVEDDPETRSVASEESGSFLGGDDVSMSEVHSCALPVPVISFSVNYWFHFLFFSGTISPISVFGYYIIIFFN